MAEITFAFLLETFVLADIATELGLELDSGQLEQFRLYTDELLRWNARLNLTAITDEREIAQRHFGDALRLALSWGDPPQSLIDIGAGAGFPGIPLKILRPTLRLTLVESIEKKAAFLRHVIEVLGLAEVTVIPARAETIGRDPVHREAYDIATARAVAELRVLAEYCLPLCRVGGRFLAPKGADVAAELHDAEYAITLLGGHVAAVEPVVLAGVQPRTLVVIEKIAPTPERFPRPVGVPSKRPLRAE